MSSTKRKRYTLYLQTFRSSLRPPCSVSDDNLEGADPDDVFSALYIYIYLVSRHRIT